MKKFKPPSLLQYNRDIRGWLPWHGKKLAFIGHLMLSPILTAAQVNSTGFYWPFKQNGGACASTVNGCWTNPHYIDNHLVGQPRHSHPTVYYQQIIRSPLLSVQVLHKGILKKNGQTGKTISDPSHHADYLFQPFPSGRRRSYRSLSTQKKNSLVKEQLLSNCIRTLKSAS